MDFALILGDRLAPSRTVYGLGDLFDWGLESSKAGGNAAYKGGVLGDSVDDYEPGFWIKNGKVWNMQQGEKIRPLPGMKKHPFE